MSDEKVLKIVPGVPKGSKRVLVKPAGSDTTTYKHPSDIQPGDEIQLKKDGSPVVMLKTPGRPADIPDTVDPKDAEFIRQKHLAVRNDEVVKLLIENPNRIDVLDTIMIELARESGAIKYERENGNYTGAAAIQLSAKRVQTLKLLSEVWIKKYEAVMTSALDIKGKKFEAVMKLWLETLQNVCNTLGYSREQTEVFFNTLDKQMDGWEKEAEFRIKRLGGS